MGNVNELAAMIESDRAEVAELSGPIDASKGQAEATAGAVAQLGIDGRAAQLRQAVDRIEEAQAIRAALEGVLVKAHWQAMSAVHGTMGPGARGSGPGGSFVAADGTVTTRDGSPAAGHLDAVPPHFRQDPTPTGEELTGVDPTLSPFQKEHENANADRRMNRLARASRLAVKNIDELKTGGQQVVSGANADINSFGPPPSGGYNTMTQVPDHHPQIHSVPAPQPSATDIVGSAIVMAVVIAEGAGRILERRKRRHDGG
jgi:hypothetical protein